MCSDYSRNEFIVSFWWMGRKVCKDSKSTSSRPERISRSRLESKEWRKRTPAPSSERTMATSTESLESLGQKHVTKGLGRLTTGIISKGEGSYVNFQDGRRILDFTCGIGVTGLGESYWKSASCSYMLKLSTVQDTVIQRLAERLPNSAWKWSMHSAVSLSMDLIFSSSKNSYR